MDEDGGEWSRGNSHRHSYGSDSDSDPGSDDDTFADEEFDETRFKFLTMLNALGGIEQDKQ